MKKFLTFFAMMFALLGFSIPVSADPSNLYFFSGSSKTMAKNGSIFTTQVDATSNDVYGYITYSNTSDSWDSAKAAGQALVPDGHTSSAGNYTATNLNNTKLITWGSPWSNSYYFAKGKKYDLTVEFKNNVPYATIKEAAKFTLNGTTAPTIAGWNLDFNNWSTRKAFTPVSTVSPYKYTYEFKPTSSNVYLNLQDSEHGTQCFKTADLNWNGTKSTTTFETCEAGGNTGKQTTITNLDTNTTYLLTLETLSSGDVQLSISEAGPVAPAAPSVSASNNTITMSTTESGCEIWYTLDSTDPATSSTATKYEGQFKLTQSSTTIIAKVKNTTSGLWSGETKKTFIYGMPVPTITISSTGLMTISIPDSEKVSDGVIKYVKGTVWNDASAKEYTAPVQLSESETGSYIAKYTSATYGNSAPSAAVTYSGVRTVQEVILYTRQDIKDGNGKNSGKATAASADGTWKLGTVSIPSGANSTYWNSTMSVKVVYTDDTETWYSTTASTEVNTIQPNGWKNTYARSTWPANSSNNCGFFVEGSAGKKVTVYAKFSGEAMQINAVMPYNALTIGSSAPQITGYGSGIDSWSTFVDFDKVSDSPKTYEYKFTAGDPTSGDYLWYGLKINGTTYKPANLSLGESTYTFTSGTPSGSFQATIKGLTTGTQYALTLTETELGLCLSIAEAGIPKPVFVRAAESNVVTIAVPDGCTLHYTVGGSERTSTSNVTLTIPTEGMSLSAYFTKDGAEGQGETVSQNFTYYTAPERWASVEWSLSDDGIMPRGTVKYFYLSRYQNDDRLSPEWELIKNGNDYTLDYFMCIPAAEFRLRRVAKDNNGNISYRDFGLDGISKVQPATIGATASTVGTADAPKQVSKSFTLYGGTYGNKSKGYAWDLGYTMVSVKVTDSTNGSNSTGPNTLSMTLSADFSKPSTANVAPIKGMPYIALTGSKLQIPTIKGQNIKHAVDLPDGYSNAFTNAWIQYDKDTQMYVYGSGVTGNNLYTGGGSYYKPQDGAVMNSTILPPRYPIMFKLVGKDDEGNETETMITSNKTILKYKGKQTKQFTTPDKSKTTKKTNFAVYALNDMEMSGLFKIYSGYGGFKYGSVDNGLSLHSNWGVGHQGSKEPYASSVIPSKVAMPLNGGGPKTNADGSAYRDPSHTTTQEPYDGYEDNYAGRYFEFDKRTYVSELDFYYALEPDTEPVDNSNSLLVGGTDNTNYNSHHADDATWGINNTTNDGRNFSWFRFVYSGIFGEIKLDKTGVDSGRVTWSINKNNVAADDVIKHYTVTFYQVDPSKQPGEDGYIISNTANKTIVGPAQAPQSPDDTKHVTEKYEDEPDLAPGWYEAKLEYTSDAYIENEDGEMELHEDYVKKSYSTRILIVKMSAADITAKQRVTTASDGVKVYHPVIDVTPDASGSIKALDASVDVATVYAEIEVEGISTNVVTRITDMDGNGFPEYTETAPATGISVKYDRANRKATVHYPQGFFTSRTVMPDMRFAVRNAAIDKRTNFSMTISSSVGQGASSETYAMVYMPAGQLYGKLKADKLEDGAVKFNALAVTNQDDLPAGEPADGYARIRYVDKNDNDALCYIGTMGGTEVKAEIKYVTLNEDGTHKTEKTLFGGEKLDMRLNPDNQEAVYTSKRVKIAGIPYQTETVTDASGATTTVRKDQQATFSVQLTYSIQGMEDFISREKDTTLDYAAANLTAPRDGIKDIRSESDSKKLGEDGVATDVTTVSDHYIENHGGLFTNIEDAHVALQAKSINEELVGNKDFNLWTMEHGEYFPDAATYPDGKTTNPFSPVNHLAIGQKGPGGMTPNAPEDVHNLLRSPISVNAESDFQNTSTVNNAWWNQRAYTAPFFHTDHIKGGLIFYDNGSIEFGEKGPETPKERQNFWAGVRPENESAYDAVWGTGYIELTGSNADAAADGTNKPTTYVHDPRHSYYDTWNHHTSVRSAYKQGEIPLNANDILCLIGKGNGQLDGTFSDYYANATHLLNGAEGISADVKANLMVLHGYDQFINENAGSDEADKSVTVAGKPRNLYFDATKWWNLDNLWKTREDIAFDEDIAGFGGKSPAEYLFDSFNNHMIFKVNHVNHESWFVPGAKYQILQHDLRTRPIWSAFKDDPGFKSAATDEARDNYVMNQLRMNLSDYCPLEYTARYSYPFLTTEKVTAENYNNSAVNALADEADVPATEDFTRIAKMYNTVTDGDVTNVVAPSRGRVPFFGATKPEDVVPTAIDNVSADNIPGNGFSILYNRAAGTVTVTALGERELKDAAVYDISGSSLISGATSDRVNDRTIVLDVRGIAQGAYIVSTNLGGAKFMK